MGLRIIAHVLAAHATKSEQVQMLLGSEALIFKFFNALADTAIHTVVKNKETGRENLEFLREVLDYVLGDQDELPKFEDEDTNDRFENMILAYTRTYEIKEEKKRKKEDRKNAK